MKRILLQEDTGHIDSYVQLKETEEGVLQQYVYDEKGNEINIGILLKTVAELLMRYKSISGYELKYWDKDYPQTGQ